LGSAPGRPGDKAASGSVAALVTRGVDALDPYFARYLPQLVVAAVVPVCVLAVLAVADPGTALIVAITLPLIPIFGFLIGTYTEARTARQWSSLERLAGHFADVVTGLATLKVFGRARFQASEIQRVSREHRVATMASLRIAFLSALVLELAATISVAVVAVTVGFRLLDGGITFQLALFLLILAPEAYLPLRQVGAQFHAAQEGLAAADRLFAEIRPAVAAPAPGPTTVTADELVLRDGLAPISFTAEPGTITALTAPSGSGKSSLFAALLGFHTPVSGALTRLSRDQVSWLPQHPTLFEDTIAANLAVPVPDAPAEAVRAAAAQTGVLTFTTLDTRLGPDGAGLSAGQRQRVALARVALRCALLDTPVLLLDEPTAHLDVQTELDLADTITALTTGRTTLLATHRPTLATRAHQTATPHPEPQKAVPA
ncbi:thiol reductant ABC exporter subunit CydD, partial [Actinocorallia lasiicapitis]